MTDAAAQEKPSRLLRILNSIEVAGNKLPDPVTLFLIAIGIVMVLSAVRSMRSVCWTRRRSGSCSSNCRRC